jgi:hypothetical protein
LKVSQGAAQSRGHETLYYWLFSWLAHVNRTLSELETHPVSSLLSLLSVVDGTKSADYFHLNQFESINRCWLICLNQGRHGKDNFRENVGGARFNKQ